MPYPLPLTRTEAYLAYKAGVIQQSDLKPSLAVPRNGIDAWLAYWTGLAADYPKREDGTPHILQEEEAYIAYLCGVINEYPEKCLRRVGAYLRYLISARWGRPDRPLNREELYLSLIKTQFIPSGDPSSDIVIDGTAKAAFVDVKMYGDTFQKSYTGKNLCGGTLAQLKNRNQGGTWNGNQYTQAGITWTVYENADGTIDRIEASGQATENGKTFYIKSFNRQQFEEQLGSEDTYTLSGCPQGGDSGYYARVVSIPWKVMLTDRGSGATGTLVPADDYNNVFVVLCVDIPAGQVNNLVFRPQLEKGSTATSYEPYVGGVPSPNPDYPQAVNTVTGRQMVKVEGGKNLFNPSSYTTVHRYPRGDMSIANNQNAWSIVIPIKGDTTYTISTTNRGLMDQYAAVGITTEDPATATGIVAYASMAGGATSATVTSPANGKYMMIYVKWSNTDVTQAIADTLQLEIGSEATEFEPFISKSYDINLNCNIYDKDLAYMSVNDMKTPIDITPGHSYHYGATTRWVGAYLYDASGTLIRTVGHTAATRSGDFTAASNEVKAVFSFYAGPDVTWSWSNVEFYDLAGVIELCKIGTYQDYIWKDGDDWKVHKEIGEVTLDGSETWTKASANSGYRFWTSKATDIKTSIDAVLKANRLGVAQGDTWDNYGISGSYSTNPIRLYIRDALFNDMTAEQLRGWLATHNIIAYYALATATDTTITDTALIAQLEALVAGGAENGTTYIKVNATDPNLPGLLYVEAPKYE